MAIESATYISDLQPSNPAGSDPVADGDNHIRLIKQALRNTFPALTGPVNLTNNQLASFVPPGVITMWIGAPNSIPPGWALCDGRTVALSNGGGNITVPDLRNQFIAGAGGAYGVGQQGGAAGRNITTDTQGFHAHTGVTDAQGNHNHTGATTETALNTHQMPPHDHSLSFAPVGVSNGPGTGPYSVLNVLTQGSATGVNGGGGGHLHGIYADGQHAHNISTYGAGAHAHNAYVETIPPFIALCFICKV